MAVVLTANDDTQLCVDHARVDQTAVRGCGFTQSVPWLYRVFTFWEEKKNPTNSKLHSQTVSPSKCFKPSGLEGGEREEFSGIFQP